MLIGIVIAVLVAFTSSKILGKKLIPRLEKKGFTQPLKEEVKEKVYIQRRTGMRNDPVPHE